MDAERRVVDSVPELYLDGELQPRMCSRPDLPAYLVLEKMDQYSEADIRVHLVSLHRPLLLCWDGGDRYDCTEYEAYVRHIVRYQPEARLILYLGIRTSAPYQWYMSHPEECTLLSNGVRLDGPSIASEVWRRDSCEAVRRIVRHFEECEVADHVIGYNFVMGANEWFAYGAYHTDPVEDGFADYSEPFQRHFRRWVRDRYDGDVEALREGWRDDDATFDEVRVPSPEERLNHGHHGMFYSYETCGHRLVDFYRCWNDAWCDMAETWCRTAKEAAAKPLVCGLMNAYAYCAPHVAGFPQVHGHGALMKLLESPHVDFFQSPYHYYNRCFGGTHYSQHAPDSVLLHGKLMLDQIDTKTHLKHGPNTNATTPFETEQVLKRDFAHSLTKNCHCYWMEIHRGVFGGFGAPSELEPLHYDSPDIRSLIGRLRRLSDENQQQDTQNVTEVAFFTSKQGTYYLKSERMFQQFFVDALRQWVLPGIGTPFDDYVLEDFTNVERDYEVYIFPNAVYVREELRTAIRRKVEQGATAVFFYAPGYADDRGTGPDKIKALTSVRLAQRGVLDFLQVDLAPNSDHPLLQGVSETSYGTDMDAQVFNAGQEWLQFPDDRKQYRFHPLFYAADPDAEVLGTLRRVHQPGLVVKQVGRGTIIYSAAPLLPATVLRNAIAAAGAHIYSPRGDLVYASSGYVCVRAAADGTETVMLPQVRKVEDALTGEEMVECADTFSYETRRGEMRIFRLTPSPGAVG